MRELKITPDVAKALVDAGTAKNYKSTQTVRKSPRLDPERDDVRPAVLRTGWVWCDDDKCWCCKIRFIVNGEQAASLYNVYAPSFLKSTTPPVSSSSVNPRVYVVWRGRWEVVSFVPDVPEYAGGDGITIDNVNGVITNTGVIDAIIAVAGTSNGATVNDGTTLFFAEDDFRVGSRGSDSGGGSPCVALNAKRVISLVAGDNVEIKSVQNPGFREYTISAIAPSYVWPGMPITINHVSGYLATSINTGSGGAFSPVTFDGKALVFRDLSEIEVITSAYINALGVLEKTTKKIWAYLL